MTAILAARVAGGILVGADRAWSDDEQILECGPKIIRVGPWLLACAGEITCDWEALQEQDPRTPSDVSELLGTRSDVGAILVRNRVLRVGGCSKGGAWQWGTVRGDAAIGSGAAWVRGAWDALAGYESDPEKRMKAALRVAARRCPSVAGPFDVVWG
jgi:hypothetical protein